MGSVIQNVNHVTLEAGEVLTAADIGRAGIIDSNNQVVAAGAGAYPEVIIREIADAIGDGVSCHHVASSVRLSVTLAGTVVIGSKLTTEAAGDFIEGTSGDKFCLVAQIAGATGETITAMVVPADVVG